MNKKIITLFFALVITFISCDNKKSEEIIAPEGMHTLNLTRFGKPFAIFVPDTVAERLEVVEQSNGALDIKVGKNFAVSINEQAADIELIKQDLKSDEVNKLKDFSNDEPTAISWESEIVQPEYHFVVNQKIANTDYNFQDIRDTESNPFGKAAIQKMFESSKNVKEIKK